MTYNHDYCNHCHPCVIFIDFPTHTNANEKKYDGVRLDDRAIFDVKMSVYDAGIHSWCS